VQSSTWSSESYLREATGPLAPFFRWQAGDSVRQRLTLGEDNTFPTELDRDWQAYFDRFVAYNKLDTPEAEAQHTLAQGKLDQSKANTLHWLLSERSETTKPSPSGTALKRMQTMPDRLKEYDGLVEELRRIEQTELPRFGTGSHKRYLEIKSELSRMRNEMKSDLAKQSANMQKTLAEALTPEQKKASPLAYPVPRPWQSHGLLQWTDTMVRYGLVAVGVCLLLGLFTRTACLVGALFLLLFYLAMMPLPFWPDNPRAEGHYILINKNIIEMLALLALATTQSGRWAGLDGLLHLFRRQREQPAQAPASVNGAPPVSTTGAGTAPASPLTKESTHGS
jgi:uncharacterized membrane protein YphA (DoxX/SURF4 family)